jgi:hypothetical protein
MGLMLAGGHMSPAEMNMDKVTFFFDSPQFTVEHF